jgi:hypothetical protein
MTMQGQACEIAELVSKQRVGGGCLYRSARSQGRSAAALSYEITCAATHLSLFIDR